MKRYFELKTLFFALALILAFSGAVFAQEETAATVNGQVTDATGAVVSGATVVITHDATRAERRMQTNEDGQFVFTPLAPGTYTLTVEQPNFKKYQESSITLDRKSVV